MAKRRLAAIARSDPLLGEPLGATLYDLLIRTTPPQEERAVVYEETALP